MIHSDANKEVVVIAPISVSTTEVTASFDTLGYDWATILLDMETEAVSATVDTFTLSEGEATNSFTAIAAFTLGDTTNCVAAPTPDSSSPQCIKYEVDLRKRKRYLKVGLGFSAARISSVHARLSRAEVAPVTDAECGCAEIVRG